MMGDGLRVCWETEQTSGAEVVGGKGSLALCLFRAGNGTQQNCQLLSCGGTAAKWLQMEASRPPTGQQPSACFSLLVLFHLCRKRKRRYPVMMGVNHSV